MKGFLSRVTNKGDGDQPKSDQAMTPKSEVIPVIKGKERRRSSFAKQQRSALVKDLPLLSETPILKRETLFRQKLKLCGVIFDFEDPDPDTKGVNLKRETLVELAEYVNTPAGQKIFTEAIMPDIVEMVRANLFRALPPQAEDFDPDEDEPAIESAWPHLQVVYEFFLRFIVSTEVNGKVAKKFVDINFIRSWVELFDAEDPRERDYVKTGKFYYYYIYLIFFYFF